MKTLLVLVALGAAAYFLMNRAKQNAVVQEIQKAPEKYVNTLQKDVSTAQQTADAANKVLKEKEQDVQKALDSAQ